MSQMRLSLIFLCLLVYFCTDNFAYVIRRTRKASSSAFIDQSFSSVDYQKRFSALNYRSNSSPESTSPISLRPLSFSKNAPKELVITTEEIKEAKSELIQSVAFMAAATGFAAVLSLWKGSSAAIEFSAGYVLELCLSVDNLFVFLLLFDYFKVEKKNQGRVLKWGIIGAIGLRGLFVAVGSVALEKFHQILLGFALILGYSAYNIILNGRDEDEEEDLSKNQLVQLSKRFFRSTDKFDGEKFFTIENGVKLATPLFICLVCIEFSDVLFALDSVPAIFGVTEDPFIVYTSNIFAIAGLRALYGTLSNAVKDLGYLEKAVGCVLSVISVKMVADVFGYHLIDPLQSLILVLSILGCGVVLSIKAQSKD